MPVKGRLSKGQQAKRDEAIAMVVEITCLGELEARALLSRARWSVSVASDIFCRREKAKHQKTQTDIERLAAEMAHMLVWRAADKHDMMIREWDEANQAWEREWELSIARLMHICGLNRNQAIEYFELEEVDYDLFEAVAEHVKVLRHRLGMAEGRNDSIGVGDVMTELRVLRNAWYDIRAEVRTQKNETSYDYVVEAILQSIRYGQLALREIDVYLTREAMLAHEKLVHECEEKERRARAEAAAAENRLTTMLVKMNKLIDGYCAESPRHDPGPSVKRECRPDLDMKSECGGAKEKVVVKTESKVEPAVLNH